MTSCIIAFASVTQANKAINIFGRNGIPAQITRAPTGRSKGCGYGVAAKGSAKVLTELLEKNGMSYKSISVLSR